MSPILTSLRFDLVLVVESGGRNGHAADEDRIETGERGHGPRPSDVNLDVLELGGALLRGELVCDRPSRGLGRVAELLLLADLVDLHDRPVDLVRDVVPVFLPVDAVLVDLIERLDAFAVRVRPESDAAEHLEGLPMRREAHALDVTDAVTHEAQCPLGRDAGVLLPERAGGRVAWVGERLADLLPQALVELLEVGRGHVNLAARFEDLGVLAAKLEWDRFDRLQVRGDVLTGAAIPARGPLDEHTVLVDQIDRHPVHLLLGDESFDVAPEPALGARSPGLQFLEREDVVERHHRGPVLHRSEEVARRRAHPLRRTVGGDELGELVFQSE